MNRLGDTALVMQVAVFNNKRAFDTLVRKYQSPLRRFLLTQTLGDSQLSDDLAQDTFIKAYVSIGKFAGRSSFQTWLFRIAYNVFLDYTRSKHVTDGIDAAATLQKSGGSTDEGLRMDLYAALALLTPHERTCITLQLTDGYKINQIAEITGITANTVKSHLARGKEKLSEYLKKNGYDKR